MIFRKDKMAPKKVIYIQAWPEVTKYLPALVLLPSIITKENDVFIDFSKSFECDSTGLNILLIKLIKIIETDSTLRKWNFNNLKDNQLIEKIMKLGFFRIINDYLQIKNIFIENSDPQNQEPIESSNHLNDVILSYPIYRLNLSSYQSRRDAIDGFKSWLYKILFPLRGKNFNFSQFSMILIEMAKNSADHTNGDAFFGMDIKFNQNKNLMQLRFSMGDLGVGIYNSIQKYIESNNDLNGRSKHLGVAECYHKALQYGVTTLENSKCNLGIGMSIISESSKKMPMRLSVFDANSRGLLSSIDTKSVSHRKLRQNFIDIGRDVGFYYYGEFFS